MIFKNKKIKEPTRDVPALDQAAWYDGYLYIENDADPVLRTSIYKAIEGGFTSDEIFNDFLRKFGEHRIELAYRVRNFASYVIADQGDS